MTMTTTNEELVTKALNAAIFFRDYEPGQMDTIVEEGLEATANLLDRLADALAAVPAPTEEVNSRFNEIKDRLIAATGTPGLTSFHDGKVHMTLGEWERLVSLAEKTVPAPTDPREPSGDDYEAGYAEGFHHGRSTPAQPEPTVADREVLEAAVFNGFMNTPGGGRHEGWSRNMARIATDAALPLFRRTPAPKTQDGEAREAAALIVAHTLDAAVGAIQMPPTDGDYAVVDAILARYTLVPVSSEPAPDVFEAMGLPPVPPFPSPHPEGGEHEADAVTGFPLSAYSKKMVG